MLVRSGRSALASFSAIVAVALVGSSLVLPGLAFAAHTATVTVSPTLVKGGTTGTYTFTIGNDGSSTNFIDDIIITVPTDFSIDGSLVCPTSWGAVTTGLPLSVECLGSANPGAGKNIAVGASANVSFTATAPSADSINPWEVYTEDNAFAPQTNNPVTTVDATAPTISSITTKDTDANGRVDTATIVFSEAIDDLTFAPNDFSIGDSTGTSISTGTADDNTFDVVVAGGVAGTGAKDVTYTKSAGAGADMVGNLLADVNAAAFNEIDAAKPIMLSAETITTTRIDTIWSENINGVTVNDSGTEFTVAGFAVSAADDNSDNIVELTVATMPTGATPDVTFTNISTFRDLNGNEAVTPTTVTAADGIAPTFTVETITTTTIQVTFSENVDGGTTASAWTVGGIDAVSATDPAGGTTLTLTVATMGTGDTPVVAYVAANDDIADTATNEVTNGASAVASDGVAPTVAITSSESPGPTNVLSIPMTITFSENVMGFDITDITVTNGTKADFAVSNGSVYTFNIASPGQGTVTADVAGNAAQDAASNNNAAAEQFSITFDSVAPTVAIVLADYALKVGDTSLVTIIFSEPVTDFDNNDITFDNGTLTPVETTDDNTTWTATFTPNTGTYLLNVITIDETGVADLAGNAGTDTGSSGNYAIDTVRPTVTVGIDDTALNAGDDAIVTFTFSEVPTDFNENDVMAESAEIGAVSATENLSVFTAVLTPNTSTEESLNVLTISSNWTDAAGNTPEGATDSESYAVETTKPSVELTSLTADPTNGLIEVTAQFSENVNGFDAAKITVGGGVVVVESFDGAGTNYTFNVNPDEGADVAVTIEVLENVAVDEAGNDNTASNQLAYTSDTVEPTVLSITPSLTTITEANVGTDKFTITIDYSEAMNTATAPQIPLDPVLEGVPQTLQGNDDASGWFDEDTYERHYNVLGNNVTQTGVDISVTTATDLAGNTQTAGSSANAFDVDTKAPFAPSTPDLAAASDSNITDDNITSDNTPTFTGTAEANSTVEIYDGGGSAVVGTESADGSGNWTITTSELLDGIHSIYAKATDAAGNEGPASGALSVRIDTEEPTTSLSLPATDSVIKGTTIELTSTASDTLSGVTCQYKIGSEGPYTALESCINGDVDLTDEDFVDGRNTFYFKATDDAGNSSEENISFVSFVIDLDDVLTVNGADGADFTTIQEAVTKATAGDAIDIAAGDYAEDVVIDKNLVLTGTGDPTATSFTLNSGVDVAGSSGITAATINVNSGAKIQDGILLASSGETVNVGIGTYADTLTVNKSVTIDGGGIATQTASVTVTADNVTLNSLIFTGDFGGDAAINLDNDTPHSGINLTNNIFSEAITTWFLIRAGANKTDLTITDNTFTGSTGGNDNGLILLGVGGDNINVSDNAFSNFPSTYSFFVIIHNASGGPRTTDLTINNNIIDFTGYDNEGGAEGISVRYADSVHVDGNTLTGSATASVYETGITLASVISTDENNKSTVNDNIVSGFSQDMRMLRWSNEGFTDGVSIIGNTLTNGVLTGGVSRGTGLYLAGTNLVIQNNEFSGNANQGIYIPQEDPVGENDITGTVVSNNKISDNTTYGVRNLLSSTLDASANWWGDATGPAHSSNSLGTGNAVSDNVTFRPWCIEDTCTDVDAVAPTVALTYSADLAPAGSMTITATYSEDVAGTPQISIDQPGDTDISDTDMSGSGTVWMYDYTVTAADGSAYIDGMATVSLSSVNDPSGNIAESPTEDTFTIDTTNPTTSVTAPAGDGSYNGNIEITADATDDSGIQKVEFYHSSIDDTLIDTDYAFPYETTWNSTDTSEETHSIYVKAYDNAGNVSTSESISVTLDRTAPAVAITAPAADARVNGAAVITFSNAEGTPECSVDEGWVECASETTTLSDIDGFDVLEDGGFTLYLRDTDTAGNEGTTQVALVKDTSAPSITSKTPDANAVGIDPAGDITVVFDEDVMIGSGNVTGVEADVTGTGTNTATIDPTSNLANNTTYTITLTGVTDTAGNALPETSWSFTTSGSYSIDLTSGWNLISLPVVPTNTAASAILGALDVSTTIDSVWKYDPEEGTWSAYHPGSPETSNFSTMTAGEGYWVSYLSGTLGTIAGTGNLFQEGNSTPPQKTLAAGWNLIGYYQLENTTTALADNALSTVTGQWTQLRTYNNTTKQFQAVTGDDSMGPGEGYWIFMKSSSFAPYLYGPGDTDPIET